MGTFSEVTTVSEESDGLYTGAVDDTWLQGPGAFGGVPFGAMLHAMAQSVADPGRAVRSMTAELCAPLRPGPFAVEVTTIRKGGSVSSLRAELIQDEGPVAASMAMFGASREQPVDFGRVEPLDVPEPDAIPSFEAPLMPTFTQHFEYKFCVGSPPLSGANHARVGGWLRPRPAAPLDHRLLAALLDAYPPAILAGLTEMRPISTAQMNVSFLPALDSANYQKDAFYLVEKESLVSDDGYCEEQERIWGPDGRFIAQGSQTVVIID